MSESESCSVTSNSLQLHGRYSPWNSSGQNTGVGSLSLLQGIFPTQGLNPGLLHCRLILYQLSHKGSPIIPEWVAYPFSRGSSRPRNRTQVSCIAGGSFTNWVTREIIQVLFGIKWGKLLSFGKEEKEKSERNEWWAVSSPTVESDDGGLGSSGWQIIRKTLE